MFFISSIACGCLWSSLFHCLLMLEANPPKAGESIGATPVVAAWQILTSGKCSIDVTNEVNLYASRSKSANVLCSVPWKIILSWHQWLPRCWVCLLVIAGQNLPKMPKWMPYTDASRMHGTALVHKCHVCFGQPLRLVHCRMLQDPRWRLAEQVPRVFLLCLVFPRVPSAWFFIKFWLFYSVLQCSTAHSALWVQVAQVQAIAEEAKSHKSHKLRKDSVGWTSWTGIRNISEYSSHLFAFRHTHEPGTPPFPAVHD